MNKLIVVGSGIKTVAHITEETRRVIQYADKVLYLVNEEHLKSWITREAKESESLDAIYFSIIKRIDAYQQITNYIIDQYNKFTTLCVVFYGHPAVFADSALKAVKSINAAGGNAVILPAISSMDCLFSDLQIDPGDQGFFSIDATELLLFERSIDPKAHVVLWQISSLGAHDLARTKKIDVLSDYLKSYYKEEHPICIYEAALYPTQKPRIEWTTLIRLIDLKFSSISSLYIPPVLPGQISSKYLTLLGMDIENFQLSSQSDTSTK